MPCLLFHLILRPVELRATSFREGDDYPGAPLTIVLGYDAWQTRYGGDSSMAGKTVKVNGESATILGVMSNGFMFPEVQEVWIPRRDVRTENVRRGSGPSMQVVGRLKDGVSTDQAFLDLSMIAQRLVTASSGCIRSARVLRNQFSLPRCEQKQTRRSCATCYDLLTKSID